MPGELTEITELATAVGIIGGEPDEAFTQRQPPPELAGVDDATWLRLTDAWHHHRHRGAFLAAHSNGRALAGARDGLRNRPPLTVEWKGPQHTPGDDTVPADLRIDHVYLVSCKYLSKVLTNSGPARLFDRLLVGDERSRNNWFAATAPADFDTFYRSAVAHCGLGGLPDNEADLTPIQRRQLRTALSGRALPGALAPRWAQLCDTVSHQSAHRWAQAMPTARLRLRMLWRLLRVASVTYFVLGTQPGSARRPTSVLRLRVDSAWDWSQRYELVDLAVHPRTAGQPEVGWVATIAHRGGGPPSEVHGHVEVRWSHGRFGGFPEAKVYLDTPHTDVPGYHPLV